MTPRSLFRTLAFAEAVTWTGLIIGILAKYVFAPGEAGDLILRITGSVHGFVFLAFAATAVLLTINQRWNPGVGAIAIVSAIVPYATIPVELWLARSGRLEGAWRLEPTDDPRDEHWIDRTFRWFIRRPWLFGILLVAAIAVLFTVLLILGPPGG